jgi:hypothetical protein
MYNEHIPVVLPAAHDGHVGALTLIGTRFVIFPFRNGRHTQVVRPQDSRIDGALLAKSRTRHPSTSDRRRSRTFRCSETAVKVWGRTLRGTNLKFKDSGLRFMSD